MKHIPKLIVFLFVLNIVGCVPPTLYNWGNYSSTLYSYKKDPNDKNLTEHKKSLDEIVTVSARNGKNVPPGVFAELGFYLIKEGKQSEGEVYFAKEVKLYPESKIFIDKLLGGFKNGGKK